jgi:23S rRNA (guanosine2251-2'-O)-methyltransferase
MAGGKRGGLGGRGAKPGSHRKGAQIGSGGQRRKALEGKGPTPPAEMRKGHPAARRAASAAKRDAARSGGRTPASGGRPSRSRGASGGFEMVAGRNSVVEALRAGIPATAMYVAQRIDSDDRVREALKIAGERGIPLLEGPRAELDRLSDGAVHQGLLLQIPEYSYAHPDDLLVRAEESTHEPLLVALDGVTDPRNLGAVVRSAGAFGVHGVVVPERRAAGMTAAAWKTAAGAAARVPVARATNLARTLKSYADAGLTVVGLAAEGTMDLADLEVAVDGLVLVVGSEGRGLGRLVAESCDLLVRIPMAAETESLNAGVAAGIALYEIAQRRRASGRL